MKKRGLIIHIDCNNFYVSCHTVLNLGIRNRPVVVLSSNDGNVIARSPLAKKLGIKMGQAWHEVRPMVKTQGLAVFSLQVQLYGAMSTRVMNVIRRFVDAIELYSIDEVFGRIDDPDKAVETAQLLKQTIQQWLHIPVSIGISLTKTLAKIATRIAKNNAEYGGIYRLTDPEKIAQVLKETKVEDLWGIGSQSAKLLHRHGIRTADGLLPVSEMWIRKHLTINGLRLVHELKGEIRKDIQEGFTSKKSIAVSPAFGHPMTDMHPMAQALEIHVARAGEKLRRQNSAARLLTVFVGTNPFQDKKLQYSASQTIGLPFAFNSNVDLYRYAYALLERLYVPGYYYHRVGIMLSGLVPDHSQQLLLASVMTDGTQTPTLVEAAPPSPKLSQLHKVIDQINIRYGRDTVRFATMEPGWKKKRPKHLKKRVILEIPLRKPSWESKHQYNSLNSLTDWDELLEAG